MKMWKMFWIGCPLTPGILPSFCALVFERSLRATPRIDWTTTKMSRTSPVRCRYRNDQTADWDSKRKTYSVTGSEVMSGSVQDDAPKQESISASPFQEGTSTHSAKAAMMHPNPKNP